MRRSWKLKDKNILLYADSESDANVLYATGFFCPDPFIFIRTANGRRIYVMSDLEMDRARSTSNAHRVLSLSHYTKIAAETYGRNPHVADVIAAVFRDLKIRGVFVPENFPAGLVDRLRKRAVRVSVAADPLFPQRLTKNAVETRKIRAAMRSTESGFHAAVDVLRKSKIQGGWVVHRGARLTADRLRRAVNAAVFDNGCAPSHTIVAPGRCGCDPHNVGSGPIRANQPIIIDVFPRSEKTGYFGDITRTFVKGRASEKVGRMYDAVLAGQKLGLKMIRHGAMCRDIHQSILDLFESRGFPTGEIDGRMQGFFHGTGHGLGLEVHEPPRIALNDQSLEAGMVVTVEPGLYYQSVGGVRIEDTVVVTKTGMRNLTRLPKFLEIP